MVHFILFLTDIFPALFCNLYRHQASRDAVLYKHAHRFCIILGIPIEVPVVALQLSLSCFCGCVAAVVKAVVVEGQVLAPWRLIP